VKLVAIANPEHAPYGRAAVAALRTAHLYEAVAPKLAIGENVAQALQFAQSGAADAAFVALSLALAPNARNSGTWFDIPESEYPRIEQGGVILRAARDLDSARAFRMYLLGSEARAILQQYGFALPDK
jgi:molybdate transport system substrate-binding protein